MISMRRWIRLVAFCVLAFALLDVCVPEPCDAAVVASSSSSSQASVDQGTPADGDCCAFEEDCFSCGHYAPPTSVRGESVAAVGFAEPVFGLSVLSGAPSIPYRPPRA